MKASALVLGIASAVPAFSVEVDTELLILVDTTRSISNREFDNVMEGIARSFESGPVLDVIGDGAIGSIAASLVFWSGSNEQLTAVSWLEVSDLSSAAQFAAAVRSASRPFSGQSAIGSAIAYGAGLFGTETGSLANGFESSFQAISFFGDGQDNNTPGRGNREARIRDARDGAIAAGVDEVSAVLLNTRNPQFQSYYEDNVLGSSGETVPSLALVDPGNVDQIALQQSLASSLSGSLSVVPEPSVILFCGVSGFFFFNRRRC
ncbi:DUF1194 domain-containing protein [Roseibacillus persicicus]|uniref:DUF1194 domain-containing protein n=1 Tax=Roseibacillus persicicus TaxID=454148 RepID=UPI00398B5A52